MDFFNDSFVSNVSLLLLREVEPLPRWVLESVSWISFLCSSPWLWENRFVVGGKSVDFFNDTIVTDILCFVVMFVVVLVLLLNQ
jgi:hypothetical protein